MNWDRLIEEKIQRAIKEGAFNNLPGQGRPLKLPDDALTHEDMRMAIHLLRSNGFTLPWIAERREIEQDIMELRTSLGRAWHWTRASSNKAWAAAEWERTREAFRRRIEQVNRRIFHYNLSVPTSIVQRTSLDVVTELERMESMDV